MERYILPVILTLGLINAAFGQYVISGTVISARDKAPVAFAVVSLSASGLWAAANEKGEFVIKNVPAGMQIVAVRYLGYIRKEQELAVSENITNLLFVLQEDNLTLEEVSVTASGGGDIGTSYMMDRKALDHIQMISITDAASLLPGGKTNTSLHLASADPQRFSVNGKSSESMGNAGFGVAVEVDGVRLSNNPAFALQGSDIRNISPTSVESIEIVTGVPSVEYGDMTNGMVRISTRKGKSPYILELMTKPHTKQVALNKGFGLGPRGGVLNVSAEHTRSVSDPASPYTAYARNALSFNYSNTFNHQSGHPITFNAGISGNAGGYNSEPDPDLFVNTYRKINDGALRANLSVRWLLNKPWITNIETSVAVNYNDKKDEISISKSATASRPAIHVTEEGYHVGELYDQNPAAGIVLIPPGFWYEVGFEDSKLLNYSARIKANWTRQFGTVNNSLLIGAEYGSSGNLGRGVYYEDMRYAPDWREFRFDQVPYVSNYAVYAEDNVVVPVRHSILQLTAGGRSDITAISGSDYGTVGSFSPRFNAKYTLWDRRQQAVSHLSFRVGWGKTVKLPSLSVLYPEPGYRDLRSFSPGTTSEGQTFYAFYTMPATRRFNPDLKWQRNIQREIGMNIDIKGTKVTLVASHDKTYDAYEDQNVYTPFYFKFTDQSNLEDSAIPVANRVYSVDQITGIITVSDRTGALPSEALSYEGRWTFKSDKQSVNGSPVERARLNWVVDFRQIRALRTMVRVDGNYYRYKGVDERLVPFYPLNQFMQDGSPYKFIGFYVGRNSWSNGSVTKNVDMNVTVTTHIPAIRMIFTARLESALYNFSQNLSEYSQGSRGFVLDSRSDYFPSEIQTDIYGGDRFVGVYPEYYVSVDDMNIRIPFAEKFAWAKENDPELYNQLAKLVVRSAYSDSFNEGGSSPYFSANFGVTKELGRTASVSFNATNFFNNTATMRLRQTGREAGLFNGAAIPKFYYALSLRLKW